MNSSNHPLDIRGKIWLESEGQTVFGSGRRSILRAVQETGSLNKAAEKVNRSYRQVWSQIRKTEERLGQELLLKRKGGVNGGGAELSRFAEELLDLFDEMEKDIKQNMNDKFKQYLRRYNNEG